MEAKNKWRKRGKKKRRVEKEVEVNEVKDRV
mgnify:CR=1 FL=1